MTSRGNGITRRRTIRSGGAAASLGAMLAARQAPAQTGAKRFQGTTINVSCWSATYPKWLQDYLPEFEQLTGAKVNYDLPGFPVYNQRADLELSTGGSAYDVLNVTFIFTSRWISAGWFTPIESFLKDSGKTPGDFDFADFLPGSIAPFKNAKDELFGVPWLTDALIAGASRFDLIKAAGGQMPDTIAEMEKLCTAIQDKDGVKAFLTENHWGWTFIPYLQSFGGNVFRNPPDDLMPTLDSPEAVAAAEWFSKFVVAYGPEGAIGYNYDQALAALKAGRANLTTNNHVFAVQMGDAASSQVAKTASFGMMPKGEKGRFPGVASHAWGIPTGSKNKDAAWAFITWATSKAMFRRMALERGLGSVTRRSVLESPEYRAKQTINGVDTTKIFADTIDLARQGHMKYRTVHVYPQVNQQITKAIETIASKQMSAREALKLAQQNAITDLRRAGVKL